MLLPGAKNLSWFLPQRISFSALGPLQTSELLLGILVVAVTITATEIYIFLAQSEETSLTYMSPQNNILRSKHFLKKGEKLFIFYRF